MACSLVVQGALLDGKPATYVYINENTTLRLDLAKPLMPGQSVTVALTWRLEIPRWSDQSAVYVLFGRSQQMISLPLFYPSLAVYTDGPTIGSGRWWLLNGTERGDAAFNVASLFAVTLTLPSDWTPVASGVEVARDELDGQTRYVFVTGPSREFLVHASPVFGALSAEAYGTRVTSYYLPGTEAAGQAALRYAVQALRIYSDHFGEYPFTEMRVAPAPINFCGMEYPQVSEPWLDEALAEFSMGLYMESIYGDARTQRLVSQRWIAPLEGLRARQQDTAVAQPVQAFLNGTQCETVAYAKGALFWDAVRRFERFCKIICVSIVGKLSRLRSGWTDYVNCRIPPC